jgi:enoyl-CoA hydratase
MPTAEDIAAKILRNPRAAVESAKDTILEVVGRPLDDQLRLECLYSYSTMGDPEITARKDEFLQRRDADRPATAPAAGNGVR